MNKVEYISPASEYITIKHSSIICASTIKCPNCGSTEYKEKEVPDKGGKVLGWGITAITTLINPAHAAHMAHRAVEYEPMKTIRICKKCGTKWDV